MRHKNATTTNLYVKSLGLKSLGKALEEGLPNPKGELIDFPIAKKANGENVE
jgi:hypothetical protein